MDKNTTDLRTVTPEARNYLRQQTIRLHKEGMKTMEICCTLGVNRYFVWSTVKSYEEEVFSDIFQ